MVAAQEDDGPANPACWINPTETWLSFAAYAGLAGLKQLQICAEILCCPEISMESDDGVISEQDACSVPMDNSVPIVSWQRVSCIKYKGSFTRRHRCLKAFAFSFT